MRRPNLCGNSIGVAEDAYKPANATIQVKEEGRLSLVRRVLGGSRKKDGNCSASKARQFGVPLCDLQLHKSSVPKVLYQICFYIETHGMKLEGLFCANGGNSSAVENLKAQFNSDQEFDLEGCNDLKSVALLLIVWLKELPQPLIPQETINDLISLMNKYEGDTWWGPVCHECLLTAGSLPTNVLETVLRLLNGYTSKHPNSLSYIPNVFCPLLASFESKDISSPDAVRLMTKLIQDYKIIFRKRGQGANDSVSNVHTAVVITDNNSSQRQKKRKERQECLRLERKFVRSNSEERPAVNSLCVSNARAESMRRVSSHEDFSKARNINKLDTPPQLRKMALPLHERNSCSPQRQHPQETMHLVETVGYASDLYDENEHERRRNSERFAPQRHRNGGRRRRSKHHHSPAKENESHETRKHSLPLTKCYENSASNDQKLKKIKDKFAEKIEEDIDEDYDDDDDRSPSPISGVGSPTLDMTLQRQESLDPIPSLPWSHISPSEERLVSPRNSLVISHRTFTAPSGGRVYDDSSILDLSTQINNVKRKIKKYDEGFEREFGHKPSHADKMANPDSKKLCGTLSKLKKQLKSAKEECMRLNNCEKGTLKEEVIQEIEKHLSEKRLLGGRGDDLDLMTHEQLVKEKVAIQKVLLQLEASFGRPSIKEEKDLVRNLYERYRTVKRMLLRHAPSKMKDSVTELGTILEHEAMDFTMTTPPTSPGTSNAEDSPPPKTPELVLDNLHSLPLSELLKLQRATREEKRRLRRNLKEYEHEFQAKTGRRFSKDDRCLSEPTYVDYKQAKAKLRFIDALVTKIK